MADRYGILSVHHDMGKHGFVGWSLETRDCTKAVYLAEAVLQAALVNLQTVACTTYVYNQIGDVQELQWKGSLATVDGYGFQIVRGE